MRIGPRHKRLANAADRITRPLLRRYLAARSIHGLDSHFASERLAAVHAKLDRGETVYLAGLNCCGMHNSGIALVEVTRERGPRLICHNEEERFSGEKASSEVPLKLL